MDRRLRPRKPTGKENVQPAKRTRRAFSTVERTVHFEEVVIESKKNAGVQTEQTPTEYCLASTNAQLVQELIVKDNLIQERDQKYIEMLERFCVEKTHLTEENKEQRMEIVRLNARITEMENMPLIPIDNIGEFSMR